METTTSGQTPFERDRVFHWADYLLFSLTLGISAIIGLYYGIKMRHSMSVKEMLLGGKNMSVFPLSISLFTTLVPSVFLLGVPSETYYGGNWPVYLALAFIPATIITAHVFLPIFHRLGITSAYEYLGLRFNNPVRFMAASIFVLMTLLTQTLSIYSPALAFSLVAGLTPEVSILAAGIVCTFYTALGGLRAVVATDVFQIFIMLAGIIGLLIKGSIDAGGVDKVFETAGKGNVLELWNYNLTVATTYNFWAELFGGTVLFLSMFSVNQTHVQRYCAIKKCKDAQRAAYISMALYIVGWVLVLLVGLVIYTYYYSCDPMTRALIYSPDQVLPLFIMDTIGYLHGLPGLFTATVFGAVLSTVSSNINALAAVTLQDCIIPLHKKCKNKDVPDSVSRALVRALALFYGVITIGLAYMPVRYGTYVLNIDVTFSSLGVFGGPLLGVFMLAAFFPIANSMGAGISMVLGLLFGLWMWLGRILCPSEARQTFRPEPPTACKDGFNVTNLSGNKPLFWPEEGVFEKCPLQPLYDLSYLWYGLITAGVTLVLGILISFMTCGDRGKVVDPLLLCYGKKRNLTSMAFMHPAATKITPNKSNEIRSKVISRDDAPKFQDLNNMNNISFSSETTEIITPKKSNKSWTNMFKRKKPDSTDSIYQIARVIPSTHTHQNLAMEPDNTPNPVEDTYHIARMMPSTNVDQNMVIQRHAQAKNDLQVLW